MTSLQHPRAFRISVLWTLGLLFLGSLVHATESGLACPDWPTCFGTMVPEMTGGVFWEHLHRLVAGGLLLFFLGATYLVWKEPSNYPWMRSAALWGVGLLLVQSLLGGITVIWGLPTAVSTSHLTLAFVFLALATLLAVVSGPGWIHHPPPASRGPLRTLSLLALGLTLGQSVLGAAVRHADAGMACPDVPLCLGKWIPPFLHWMVAMHYAHRVTGILLLALVLWLGHMAFWRSGSRLFRLLGGTAALTATAQVLLGFLSVYYRLAVVPVSLHTLLAAILLVLLVALATLTWAPGAEREALPAVESARSGAPVPGTG